MKRLNIILSLLIIQSCAKTIDRVPASTVRTIDPELEPYVNEFENIYNIIIDYPIKFELLTGTGSVGMCYLYNDGTKEIKIDPNFFHNSLESQKEQLIMHELGHCSLLRKHNDNFITFDNILGDYPASIMNSRSFNIMQIQAYDLNRSYYVEELYNN